jgi:hypothetical protein
MPALIGVDFRMLAAVAARTGVSGRVVDAGDNSDNLGDELPPVLILGCVDGVVGRLGHSIMIGGNQHRGNNLSRPSNCDFS